MPTSSPRWTVWHWPQTSSTSSLVPPRLNTNPLPQYDYDQLDYGMTIGNFELDYTDGEIRYKTSIDVEGDQLTSALIKNLVYTNVRMMDEYLPGITAVIEAGVSPEEVIWAIEQPEPNHQPDQELSG